MQDWRKRGAEWVNLRSLRTEDLAPSPRRQLDRIIHFDASWQKKYNPRIDLSFTTKIFFPVLLKMYTADLYHSCTCPSQLRRWPRGEDDSKSNPSFLSPFISILSFSQPAPSLCIGISFFRRFLASSAAAKHTSRRAQDRHWRPQEATAGRWLWVSASLLLLSSEQLRLLRSSFPARPML